MLCCVWSYFSRVADLKTRFPDQFTAYTNCLDYNDYQYSKCRLLEQALKDCWSKGQGENKPTTM
ncbi:hypothetical protein EON65_17135 [archaeon]|nr:MAG: hypothetical protein EON65_17135 [archaeon]